MTSLGETYEIHKILCKSGPRAFGVNSLQHVPDRLAIRMGKHKSSYLLTYL